MSVQTWPRLGALSAVAVLAVSCGVDPGGSLNESDTTVSSAPALTSTEAPTTTVATAGGNLVEGVTGVFEGGGAFWLDGAGSYLFGDPDTEALGYDVSTLVGWVVVGPHHGLNLGHPPSGPDSKTVDPSQNSGVWLQGLRMSRAGGSDEMSWTTVERGDAERGEPAEIECAYSVRLDPGTRLMMTGSLHCGQRPAVSYEVVELTPNARIDPAVFVPTANLDQVVSDQGFRHVTLDEARVLVGYGVPVPDLPPGYVLSTVVYSPHAADSPVELRGMPSFDVVVMVFRDGFQTVTVTTRTRPDMWPGSSGSGSDGWDPWHGEYGRPATPRQGMLDGTPISFTRIDDGTGRAWAVTAEVVVTVEGALSDAELDAVLNSFATR